MNENGKCDLHTQHVLMQLKLIVRLQWVSHEKENYFTLLPLLSLQSHCWVTRTDSINVFPHITLTTTLASFVIYFQAAKCMCVFGS